MNAPNLSSISAIYISGLEQQDFTFDSGKPDTLDGIRFINILIGENSAGKSRFLRAILTRTVDQVAIGSGLSEDLESTLLKIESHVYSDSIKAVLKAIPSASLDSELLTWISSTVSNHLAEKKGQVGTSEVKEIVSEILGDTLIQKLSGLEHSCAPVLTRLQKREYIPILRGLRPLDPQKDLFKERTYSDYFDDKKRKDSEYDIFTGYSLYSDLMHSLLGLEEERESVKRFENYLSEHFFEGKPVTLIPKKDREGTEKPNDVVYVKIGGEPMRPIYELGDGIQAIITLTVRPFLAQEPTMFFIEEPEQHLHAGMQRALIGAFRACPNHKYFFTTQSNHFIDLSIESDDISLFSVKKELGEPENQKSRITNQQDRSDILKDLGVLASSVLLANCSIWVEGITDKFYLRVYLQRFIDDLKVKSESLDRLEQQRYSQRHKKLSSFNENLHYVFVEYQGSNITHWDFSSSLEDLVDTPARMLSNDIFLLADQDIDSKGTRVADLREALAENFHLLEWKEIENYVPQNVMIKTAENRWITFKGRASGSFDPSKIRSGAFENKGIGIGKTLEKAVKRSSDMAAGRKFYEDKSGTIKDKVKFCETACEIMNNGELEWGLTPELEALCDKIWTFVENNNKI